MQKGHSPLFSVMPSDRTRGKPEATQEAPSEQQETLLHSEGDRALAWVLQEVVESPSLETFKSLDMVLGNQL